MNRPRHRATLCSPVRSSAATALFSLPSAQASTILARSASACDVFAPPRPPGQLLPLGARQHEARLPPPRPRGVREPGRPGPGEPRAPLPHRLNGKPQLSGHPGIPPGRVRAGQHDPARAPPAAAVPAARQPLKLSPVLIRQRQRRNRKRHNNSIGINVR